MLEATIKGEEIGSAKWWNSKGEEVDTEEEASVFYAEQVSSTSLSDADIEEILMDAVEFNKVEFRAKDYFNVVNLNHSVAGLRRCITLSK